MFDKLLMLLEARKAPSLEPTAPNAESAATFSKNAEVIIERAAVELAARLRDCPSVEDEENEIAEMLRYVIKSVRESPPSESVHNLRPLKTELARLRSSLSDLFFANSEKVS
jgi:hypothetical protein